MDVLGVVILRLHKLENLVNVRYHFLQVEVELLVIQAFEPFDAFTLLEEPYRIPCIGVEL